MKLVYLCKTILKKKREIFYGDTSAIFILSCWTLVGGKGWWGTRHTVWRIQSTKLKWCPLIVQNHCLCHPINITNLPLNGSNLGRNMSWVRCPSACKRHFRITIVFIWSCGKWVVMSWCGAAHHSSVPVKLF